MPMGGSDTEAAAMNLGKWSEPVLQKLDAYLLAALCGHTNMVALVHRDGTLWAEVVIELAVPGQEVGGALHAMGVVIEGAGGTSDIWTASVPVARLTEIAELPAVIRVTASLPITGDLPTHIFESES